MSVFLLLFLTYILFFNNDYPVYSVRIKKKGIRYFSSKCFINISFPVFVDKIIALNINYQ